MTNSTHKRLDVIYLYSTFYSALQRAFEQEKHRYVFFLFSVVVLFTLSWWLKPLLQLPPTFPPQHLNPSEKNSNPFYLAADIASMPTKAVHAISVISQNNNDLMAFWYGGTKEAKPDVALYQTLYSAEQNRWQTPRNIMDRHQVTQDTGRMTILIGNATAIKMQQRILLFFVSVGAGGWAASSLNMTYSDDNGQSWSKVQRLISSPFLNISTLVRNPPIRINDNLIAIPAYHESLNEYSETLWLNAAGQLINKTRVLSGMHAIQPVIFSRDNHITVLHRSMNLELPQVIARTSETMMQNWQDAEVLDLPNSDSAMAGLALANGQWLLAYNHAHELRERMDLAISSGPHSNWSEPLNIEQNPQQNFAYPVLIQTPDGLIHLFYTVDRTHFRHIRFNQAWLEENLP